MFQLNRATDDDLIWNGEQLDILLDSLDAVRYVDYNSEIPKVFKTEEEAAYAERLARVYKKAFIRGTLLLLVNDPSSRILYETEAARLFVEEACARAGVTIPGMTDDTENRGLQVLRALKGLVGEGPEQ